MTGTINQRNDKIVIEVNGGNVIAVYASTPNVEVVILDYDNYQDGQEMTEAEEHAQRQAINRELFQVYQLWS